MKPGRRVTRAPDARRRVLAVLAVLAVLLLSGATSAADVTVIAHRGASGYLPEHTLEAYAYAYASGADFIEPDLVMTSDGVLIARHESMLDLTTDVAERFPDRRAADGHFHAADLSWEEVRSLRAKESRSGRFPSAYATFGVPRLEEIIALVDGLNESTGCSVGLYPELKSTAWHRQRGLDPVAALRATLAAQPFDGPLRIQSFEPEPLRELAAAPVAGAELVQLVEDPLMLTDAGLREVATYAGGVGPWLGQLAELLQNGDDAVARAQALGLTVDTWTLRADQLGPFPDFGALIDFAVATLGVDGVFTDHPDRVRNHLDHAARPAAQRAAPAHTAHRGNPPCSTADSAAPDAEAARPAP